jgi:hypothetical protein
VGDDLVFIVDGLNEDDVLFNVPVVEAWLPDIFVSNAG